MLVYLIQNLINGKVYVGQTARAKDARWHEHLYAVSLPECADVHLYSAMRKYGIENFDCIELQTAPSQEQADIAEKFFIARFNSANPDFGYNKTLGGEKYTPSKETFQKLRRYWGSLSQEQRKARADNARKYRKYDSAFSETMRLRRLGTTLSTITKEAISNSNKLRWAKIPKEKRNNFQLGLRRSEETKQKMAAAARLREKRKKEVTPVLLLERKASGANSAQ